MNNLKQLKKPFLDLSDFLTINQEMDEISIEYSQKQLEVLKKFTNLINEDFKLSEDRRNLEFELASLLGEQVDELEENAMNEAYSRIRSYELYHWEVEELDVCSYLEWRIQLVSGKVYTELESKAKNVIKNYWKKYVAIEAEKFIDTYMCEATNVLKSTNIKKINMEIIKNFINDIKEEIFFQENQEKMKNEIARSWTDNLMPKLLEVLENDYREQKEKLEYEKYKIEKTFLESKKEYDSEIREVENEINELKSEKIVDYQKISEAKKYLREIQEEKASFESDLEIEIKKAALLTKKAEIEERISEIASWIRNL